jgi:two-component system sensor histidine kinase PilS (NtrC family)
VNEARSRYFAQPTASFWKSLRYLCDARLAVAILLLAYVPLLGNESAVGQSFDARLFVQVALADFVVVGLIVYAAGGARSGLGVLMITPTAGAAILSTPLLSMFIAAAASLVLLGESLWRRLLADFEQAGSDGGLFVAAVISAALFVIVIIVNRLARRLADQERLASKRGQELRNQLAINELVIAELDQGVLLFSQGGGIEAMNPKARTILGLRPGAPVDAVDTTVLSALRDLVAGDKLLADLDIGSAGEGKSDPRTKVRARVLTAGRNGAGRSAPFSATSMESGEESVDRVVLLEDLEHLEDRAQQLKLAAMGRLSASIAHEIRNPLGAIRHAGNLLAERVPDGTLRRMTTIIEANSLRIDRIVEDVLSITRRFPARELVDLPQFFSAFLPEFVAQAGTRRDLIALQIQSSDGLLFDPHQLRQVLVNLLGNALRYASDSPGAILLSWRHSGDRQAVLRVLDDGPGVDAAARRHLFEPFFTTEAQGTGLGLHMAQELCAANGARLRYQPRSAGPGERYVSGFLIEPETAPVHSKGSRWQAKQTV